MSDKKARDFDSPLGLLKVPLNRGGEEDVHAVSAAWNKPVGMYRLMLLHNKELEPRYFGEREKRQSDKFRLGRVVSVDPAQCCWQVAAREGAGYPEGQHHHGASVLHADERK